MTRSVDVAFGRKAARRGRELNVVGASRYDPLARFDAREQLREIRSAKTRTHVAALTAHSGRHQHVAALCVTPQRRIRTVGYGDPPAKFVFDWYDRQGVALNSIVAEGTIISGSTVHNCVVGRNVRIHSYSQIEDSVIMDWAEIGRGCKIRRAIIDKSNVIPPGTEIGYDLNKDRERYFVSDTGIVVLGRGEPKTNWVTTSQV